MGSCYSSMAKKRMNDVSSSVMEQKGSDIGVLSATLTNSTSKRHKWRKKSGGFGENELFNHIPGRIVGNGTSKNCCLYTQQGKKGTNQDAMIAWENYSTRSDTIFCGVFDGHGPLGHMVSRKVRDSLPLILSTQWASIEEGSQCKSERGPRTMNSEDEASGSMDDELVDASVVEEMEKLPEMHIPLKTSLLKAFKLMDKELKFQPTIDCFCSGTTAVTLLKQAQDLIVANVGDSRAILATRDHDDSLVAIQLTVDLKPDLPREAARIQRCKGRVFALQDEPEVARVWLPNNDSPGLAMARAFGDFCLKDFGLISVPDIYYRHLTERDEFVILATDGVWDVLSNKEAVDIVASAPGRTMAARALVDSAVRAWRLKYPTSKNDDCAAVCLFLEHLSASNGNNDANIPNISKGPSENMATTINDNDEEPQPQVHDDKSHAAGVLQHSDTIRSSTDEIVPVTEATENKLPSKSQGQSKRSLAECISTAEDEEWTALEGITRVNSLLSLPRLLSSDRRSTTSWRRWL